MCQEPGKSNGFSVLCRYPEIMDNETKARLEKIESHISHLEHLCDQLNGVVSEQSREITRLQGLSQKISQTVETIELERIKSNNAKPPHYQ